MEFDFKEAFESVREAFEEQPFFFVAIALVFVAIALFWNTLLIVLKGLVYAAVALLVIVAFVLVVVKIKFRKPGLKVLIAKKKRILSALKIAEAKYMRRKLSEKDFNKLFKEKQRELIKVEAVLDQQYNKEGKAKVDKNLLAVQSKKRHILKSLLEEKRRIIKELDIAERRYLKRKIDVKTYQELVQKNQHNLIELEAEIKELYNEANIAKVMENLKGKLGELDNLKNGKKRKKKDKKREKQVIEREQQLRIAKEIVEQLKKK